MAKKSFPPNTTIFKDELSLACDASSSNNSYLENSPSLSSNGSSSPTYKPIVDDSSDSFRHCNEPDFNTTYKSRPPDFTHDKSVSPFPVYKQTFTNSDNHHCSVGNSTCKPGLAPSSQTATIPPTSSGSVARHLQPLQQLPTHLSSQSHSTHSHPANQHYRHHHHHSRAHLDITPRLSSSIMPSHAVPRPLSMPTHLQRYPHPLPLHPSHYSLMISNLAYYPTVHRQQCSSSSLPGELTSYQAYMLDDCADNPYLHPSYSRHILHSMGNRSPLHERTTSTTLAGSVPRVCSHGHSFSRATPHSSSGPHSRCCSGSHPFHLKADPSLDSEPSLSYASTRSSSAPTSPPIINGPRRTGQTTGDTSIDHRHHNVCKQSLTSYRSPANCPGCSNCALNEVSKALSEHTNRPSSSSSYSAGSRSQSLNDPTEGLFGQHSSSRDHYGHSCLRSKSQGREYHSHPADSDNFTGRPPPSCSKRELVKGTAKNCKSDVNSSWNTYLKGLCSRRLSSTTPVLMETSKEEIDLSSGVRLGPVCDKRRSTGSISMKEPRDSVPGNEGSVKKRHGRHNREHSHNKGGISDASREPIPKITSKHGNKYEGTGGSVSREVRRSSKSRCSACCGKCYEECVDDMNGSLMSSSSVSRSIRCEGGEGVGKILKQGSGVNSEDEGGLIGEKVKIANGRASDERSLSRKSSISESRKSSNHELRAGNSNDWKKKTYREPLPFPREDIGYEYREGKANSRSRSGGRSSGEWKTTKGEGDSERLYERDTESSKWKKRNKQLWESSSLNGGDANSSRQCTTGSNGRGCRRKERGSKEMLLLKGLRTPSGDLEQSRPKSILKPPTAKFPEYPATVREGVALPKDSTIVAAAREAGIPEGARWTKIDRRLVNPEALIEAHERFELRTDCVIVLRVLGHQQIQQYADRTRKIREARKRAEEQAAEVERNVENGGLEGDMGKEGNGKEKSGKSSKSSTGRVKKTSEAVKGKGSGGIGSKVRAQNNRNGLGDVVRRTPAGVEVS